VGILNSHPHKTADTHKHNSIQVAMEGLGDSVGKAQLWCRHVGQSKYAAHAALVTTQCCFSGWHIVSSIVLKGGADPVVFALYREFTAMILMYTFVRAKDVPIRVDRADFPRFCFIGVCSFVNVVFTILALQYIAATRYALFQPTIPCIATIISIILGMEAFTLLKAFGIALSVGGAVVVEAWNSGSSADESNLTLGLILVVLQTTAMACIIVFQKPLLSKYDPSLVTFVYYSIGGFVTLLLCAAWEFRFTKTSFYFDNNWMPWVGLAYASVFATLLAYNFYSWAGKKLAPSVTTVYCTLQPVGTALLSFIVFGTVVSYPQAVGGILVIAGLFVTVYGRQLEMKQLANQRDENEIDAADDSQNIKSPIIVSSAVVYSHLRQGDTDTA
jgi:drug/metabolite transporter (DMT)-like permease